MIVRRDTSSRRERIVALLRAHNSVQIPALAEMFGVSTQTLRKDLNFLDAKDAKNPQSHERENEPPK